MANDNIFQSYPIFEIEKYPGEMLKELQIDFAIIPGWPGYRTRQLRSGYDPFDTYLEVAHMEGVIIRKLLIGEVITNNLVYLAVMFFYGIVGVFPFIISIVELLQNRSSFLSVLIFFPYFLIGLCLFHNVIKGISERGQNKSEE